MEGAVHEAGAPAARNPARQAANGIRPQSLHGDGRRLHAPPHSDEPGVSIACSDGGPRVGDASRSALAPAPRMRRSTQATPPDAKVFMDMADERLPPDRRSRSITSSALGCSSPASSASRASSICSRPRSMRAKGRSPSIATGIAPSKPTPTAPFDVDLVTMVEDFEHESRSGSDGRDGRATEATARAGPATCFWRRRCSVSTPESPEPAAALPRDEATSSRTPQHQLRRALQLRRSHANGSLRCRPAASTRHPGQVDRTPWARRASRLAGSRWAIRRATRIETTARHHAPGRD